MKRIAVIDYGSGNLHSVQRALVAAGEGLAEPVEIIATSEAEEVANASHIVLPGVGHFRDCMMNLSRNSRLLEAMTDAVLREKRAFLGICVGMQLLANEGVEGEKTAGLGWIEGTVERIATDPDLRIPHVGWNELTHIADHPVFSGLGPAPHVYFTHSYVFNAKDPAAVSAQFNYRHLMTAAVAKDNIVGVQFHPEKSQAVGLKLLRNFLEWSA